jgi:hypothetical protein
MEAPSRYAENLVRGLYDGWGVGGRVGSGFASEARRAQRRRKDFTAEGPQSARRKRDEEGRTEAEILRLKERNY